jgi:hypothetical protein
MVSALLTIRRSVWVGKDMGYLLYNTIGPLRIVKER